MKAFVTKTIPALLLAAATTAFAPAAWAGCADGALKKPASWTGETNSLLTPAAFGVPSIVGMWSVSFVVGKDTIDFGYQVWHGDGTEFMNSGGRAPATQNFCLGVWEKTKPFTYKLNHFALSYDTSGVLNARVNIKETVTVDFKGNNYSGPFTIDVYDPTTNALLQHVAGQVTGQRVTVD
jgi:hypothetical protein